MAFAVRPNKPIKNELRRLARKELGRAAKCLDSDSGVTSVHVARKSVKKVRALSQLIRPGKSGRLRKDEERLREAGRALSTLRDAVAIVDTFDNLRRHHAKRLSEHAYAFIRRELVRARARIERRARAERSLARAAAMLQRVRRSAKRWPVPPADVSDLPSLIKGSFRRSRKAMQRADATRRPSDLHLWRKRVKTLWYQLRLCEFLAPGVGRHVRSLKQLETWLGEDHNLFVLRLKVARTPSVRRMKADVQELTAAMAASQEELRRRAFALGKRLHARKPKEFARYLRVAFAPRKRKRTSSPDRPEAAIA